MVLLCMYNRSSCRAVVSISYEYADHFEIVIVEESIIVGLLQGQTTVLIVNCCYRAPQSGINALIEGLDSKFCNLSN